MPDSPIVAFQSGEAFARRLDREDPLAPFRERFELPSTPDGRRAIYLCSNSLGLQPKAARHFVEEELDRWARLAVGGHFRGPEPWYHAQQRVRESSERIVGALPGAGEVVVMNGLTVNLHLLMVSFFQPTARRFKVLMEWPSFPSDLYAVKTHLATRGLDPEEALILVAPGKGEETLRGGALEEVLEERGSEIALVLVGGLNFYTGQLFDLPRITDLGHRRGCVVGFDLAHAAGNVPLELHDWDVDFACWCTYKYLSAGPGALAACFIHQRHAGNTDLPRFGGWWGNDPDTRFRMHLQPDFVPRPDAEGWTVSNPPILAMAPLRASLEIFDEIGMTALRRKSLLLTGYLRYLIERPLEIGGESVDRAFEVVTPERPEEHGCQLSLFIHDRPKERFEALEEAGVVCDFRLPNVIRLAPAPLYNTFQEVWQAAQALRALPE